MFQVNNATSPTSLKTHSPTSAYPHNFSIII